MIDKRKCFNAVFATLILWIVNVNAAEDSFALFKEITTSFPTNLLLKFTVESTFSINGVPTSFALKSEGGQSKVIKLDNPPVRYVQFAATENRFVAARSGLPLEMGFQRSAEFFAEGIISNKTWTLLPNAQVQYRMGKSGDAQLNEKLLFAFPEILAVLSLGIDKNGPLSWSGNAFQGDPLDRRAKGGAKAGSQEPTSAPKLAGSLVLSNGLPQVLVYREGDSRLSTVVKYRYAGKFELPFPSEIRVERLVDTNGNKQIIASQVYRVSEVRRTDGDEGELVFDPHYYLNLGNAVAGTATPEIQKNASTTLMALTGEPVLGPPMKSNSSVEYLFSNGVGIARMQNGVVRPLAPMPAKKTSMARAVAIVCLIGSLIPLAIILLRSDKQFLKARRLL